MDIVEVGLCSFHGFLDLGVCQGIVISIEGKIVGTVAIGIHIKKGDHSEGGIFLKCHLFKAANASSDEISIFLFFKEFLGIDLYISRFFLCLRVFNIGV